MNLFSSNTTFNGVRVFALPRQAMVNGTGAPNAGAIAYTIDAATIGDAYSLVAATFRAGSPPPAGTAEYLLAIDSPGAAGVVQTKVHVWRFQPDFTTPANSTFGVGANHTANADITVSGFVDAYTSTTLIVPQNGTTAKLDTLGDKIMSPVVYQNRAGVESLWAAHTVNNNQAGTGPTGIRWYQFNVTGGTIPATAAQQQTFTNAADGLWRFMPSISVDAAGNMAIAYSASGSTIEPGIRYAGRLAADPVNTLAQGEAVLIAGGGHQTSSSGRWGDYSALGIDPADNFSFWHTNEYYPATSSSAWGTRIGKFRFPYAPPVSAAVSRKAHAAEGDLDINLPLVGNSGIECRVGPVAGQHKIVVTFPTAVTFSGASVTSPATVSSASSSGSVITVNLANVPDVSRLSVTLAGVNDGSGVGDIVVPIAFLYGDSNGDGTVNVGDSLQVRSRSGSPDATTVRSDLNADGFINAGDAIIARSRAGQMLP